MEGELRDTTTKNNNSGDLHSKNDSVTNDNNLDNSLDTMFKQLSINSDDTRPNNKMTIVRYFILI